MEMNPALCTLLFWLKVKWLPELQGSEVRSRQRLQVSTHKHAHSEGMKQVT